MSPRFSSVPIFAGIEPSVLEFLWKRARAATIEPGGIVVKEGESGNRMFILESGAVEVRKHCTQDCGEVELARLGAGDFFGEMCMLETLPRSATVLAVSKTSIWSLSSIDFLGVYQENPAQYAILILNIARDLSRRLRKLDAAFAARH